MSSAETQVNKSVRIEEHTQTNMYVVKRNGSSESMDLNKIVRAISRSCDGLSDVDALRIATKTISGLYDGASTKELDRLSIQTAAGLIFEEPQYSKLAARLLSTYIDKEVQNQGIHAFSQSIDVAYSLGLVNDRLQKFVTKNMRKLNNAIRIERDHEFEYFGLRTVYDRYLLKHPTTRLVVESPQHFFLRIACALSDNVKDALELYALYSKLEYIPSSPTLFNSGTRNEQLSSCFLVDSPQDNLESIYQKYTDIALLSKFSGGIGLSYSRVRSRGSHIKGTNGHSNGIVPWLKTLDSSVASVSQGSKRKGACCVYLETWHADIEEFLDLRENTGDESKRTHNLNLANWIPDLFMRRVLAGDSWSLFDPKVVPDLPDLYGDAFEHRYEESEKAGLAQKTIPARDLYGKMMKTLAQTGNGWMTFKDKSNAASNQTYLPSNRIHLSNLCVAPETVILTDKGYGVISELVNQEVNVWNGKEFSQTTVKKTGDSQDLITISLSNGSKLVCTKYHKFILSDGTKTEAQNLCVDDQMIKTEWPIISAGDAFPYAYTHGIYCGDGIDAWQLGKKYPKVILYGEKTKLAEHMNVRTSSWKKDASGRLSIQLPLDIAPKFTVPINSDLNSKLSWLAGLCDTDGTVSRNQGCESIQIANTNHEFLNNVRLMLTTLGVDSKVTLMRNEQMTMMPDHKGGLTEVLTKTVYHLLINAKGTFDLQGLGFSPHRIKLSGREPGFDRRRYVTVVNIEDEGRIDDTYCFNEPKEHAGVFNGILTGQCSEITEVNSKDETAVCNLGSINLARHTTTGNDGSFSFDFTKLAVTVRTAVRQLDRVIDLNLYTIPSTKLSNNRWRPIGLGFMGLQDIFFQMRTDFDSPEARVLSKKISEEIYFHALTASCELAHEKGRHAAFDETRAAQGDLQFNAWGVIPEDQDRWKKLTDKIKKTGLRNSLLIAIAPTATIASITGCYECIEPQVSNLFKRETLSGDFLQINRYLVTELKSLGLWTDSIRAKLKSTEGSIQTIQEIPDSIKSIYRTVWEIPMRSLIDMAADRGAFIDQSQSLNLFIENPNIGQLSSMYSYAWQKGLKTTYYLRSRPASRIAKMTADMSGESSEPESLKKIYTDAEALVCSLENPGVCEACT